MKQKNNRGIPHHGMHIMIRHSISNPHLKAWRAVVLKSDPTNAHNRGKPNSKSNANKTLTNFLISYYLSSVTNEPKCLSNTETKFS